MPAIAPLVKESLSWLIKVVTIPRNIEYDVYLRQRSLHTKEQFSFWKDARKPAKSS